MQCTRLVVVSFCFKTVKICQKMFLRTCLLFFVLITTASAFYCFRCHEMDNSPDYKVCLNGEVSRLLREDCINYTSCAVLHAQNKGVFWVIHGLLKCVY